MVQRKIFTFFPLIVLNIIYNVVAIEKPNIFIILADDVGWNDVGMHGSSQIPTPCIDALGYNGAILSHFYTMHTCTPSRAALLTGKYPIRTGMQGFPLKAGEPRGLPLDAVTITNKLSELNYKNYLIGKWHLGYGFRDFLPMGKGFHSHFGYRNGFCGYFDYENQDNALVKNGFDLHDNYTPAFQYAGKTYAVDLFTEKTVEKIKEHVKNYPNNPMFTILSHLAAHSGKNGNLEVKYPAEANEKYKYITDPKRRLYADIVNKMDASVCDVVQAIDDAGILNNSIIIFFSDNGAQTFGMFENFGSNWPFAGQKFTLNEGGVRNTFAIFSPKLAKFKTIIPTLSHITDLFPTLLSAAGGNFSDLNLDGKDLWPLLSKGSELEDRADILLNIDEKEGYGAVVSTDGFKLTKGNYQHNIYAGNYGDSGRSPETPSYNTTAILKSSVNLAIQKLKVSSPLTESEIHAIRSQLDYSSYYKANKNNKALLCSYFGGYCLFDLKKDPRETKSVKRKFPDVFKRLKKSLQKYWKELVPQTNKPVDPDSNPKYCNNTWHTWLETDPTLKCS